MKTELRDRPTKEEMAQMPPFVGLPLDSIHLLKTEAQFEAARSAIEKEKFIGFDTESKPTFKAALYEMGHMLSSLPCMTGPLSCRWIRPRRSCLF